MSNAPTTARYAIKRFTGTPIAYVYDTLTNVPCHPPYNFSRPGQERRAEQHAQRLNADLVRRASDTLEPVPPPAELTVTVDGTVYVRRTTSYRAHSGLVVSTQSYFVGKNRVPITERVSWHDIRRVEAAIAALEARADDA